MPNWSDPAEIEKDAGVFQDLVLSLLGVATWEVIIQLPFDYLMITGRRQTRWTLALYLWCKYSLWFAIIGVNIALHVTSNVNCQALYLFNEFAGNTAIGSASSLLMIRTIAIWSRKPVVMVPLVVLSLGQWAILLHGIASVRSSWSEVGHTCVVTSTRAVFLNLIYIYTMSFDFIVMVVSIAGLLHSRGRSSLWILLFRQGVVYFVVAFVANLVTTVFLLLNLNPIMNIMFTIPAATASCIVACRSFVSLSDYVYRDAYVHTAFPQDTTGTCVVVKGGNGIESPVKGPYNRNLRGVDITIDGLTADSTGVAMDMDEYTSRDGSAPHTAATLSSTTIDIEKGGVNSIDSQRNGSRTRDKVDEHEVQSGLVEKGRSFGPVL